MIEFFAAIALGMILGAALSVYLLARFDAEE